MTLETQMTILETRMMTMGTARMARTDHKERIDPRRHAETELHKRPSKSRIQNHTQENEINLKDGSFKYKSNLWETHHSFPMMSQKRPTLLTFFEKQPESRSDQLYRK